MDMEYIDHWSLGLEFKILAKTIPAALKGAGRRVGNLCLWQYQR